MFRLCMHLPKYGAVWCFILNTICFCESLASDHDVTSKIFGVVCFPGLKPFFNDSLYDHNLPSSGYFQPLKLVSQCDSSVHFNEHFSHQIWIHCLCMWQHVKHACEKSAQIMQRYQVSRILKEKTSRDKERGIKHKLHLGKESKISKRDVLKQQSRHFYSIKIKSMETTSSWVFLLWFLHL